MGCTVSKKKPLSSASDSGKPQMKSNKSSKKESSSSKRSQSAEKIVEEKEKDKKDKTDETKILTPAESKTDVSKLVTEKSAKTNDPSEKKKDKQKTLEEKSAKIPSDLTENDANGKTAHTFPCATPLKSGQQLQPPKPDNGEYINFNDVLSDDDFSEDDKKDGKKKEKKEDKKDERKKKSKEKEEKKEEKKEDKKDEKKEDRKKNSKAKNQKEVKPAAPPHPCLSVPPKQEKPATDRKSARSMGKGGGKKTETAAAASKKPDGIKLHETKDAVKKMRTGAVRTRHAPHEDTLYQVPHRMPEIDFTKLH